MDDHHDISRLINIFPNQPIGVIEETYLSNKKDINQTIEALLSLPEPKSGVSGVPVVALPQVPAVEEIKDPEILVSPEIAKQIWQSPSLDPVEVVPNERILSPAVTEFPGIRPGMTSTQEIIEQIREQERKELEQLERVRIMENERQKRAKEEEYPQRNPQSTELRTERPSDRIETSLRLEIDNDEILVRWQLANTLRASSRDWIGIYRTQSSSREYVSFIYTGATISGEAKLAAPALAGDYEARLFLATTGYEPVARSSVVVVGPRLSMTAALREKSISLSFKLTAGRLSEGDWIGFYPKEAAHNCYLIRRVVTGTCGILEVDRPTKPGDYEFRFFPKSSGYDWLALSNPITITNYDRITVEVLNGLVKVSWLINSRKASSWDWVGIHPVGKPNWLKYLYIDTENPWVFFNSQDLPGSFEVAYHSRSREVIRSTVFNLGESLATW